MPMIMYNVVHTGPNIQLGGLNDGWLSVAYHSGIACAVNIPAIAPIESGRPAVTRVSEIERVVLAFKR